MATSAEVAVATSIQNISLDEPAPSPKIYSPPLSNISSPAEVYNTPSDASSSALPPSDLSTDPPPSPKLPTPPHRSHSPTRNLKRSDPFQFGSRYLDESSDDVFEFNAWDHVIPDKHYKSHCESQYARQRAHPASPFDISRFNTAPHKYWDRFYSQKRNHFFKDRKWLRQEFPVLSDVTRKGVGRKIVVELGAGAGNTAFPILRVNENEELEIWAADYSSKAVDVMKECQQLEFSDGQVKGTLNPIIWDVTSEALPSGLSSGSVDIIVLIFIFSALSPSQWRAAVINIHRLLKPGGEVLFRDYGRGDLAQVRFKEGKWMGENFYVRGDGTRVYFFEEEEIRRMWEEGDFRPFGAPAEEEGGAVRGEDGEGNGQEPFSSANSAEAAEAGADREKVEPTTPADTTTPIANPAVAQNNTTTASYTDTATVASTLASAPSPTPTTSSSPSSTSSLTPTFTLLNLSLDRRLIVNRQRRLKMYRCWLQGRFRKKSENLITNRDE